MNLAISSLLLTIALCDTPPSIGGAAPGPVLASPVSHSDWMLRKPSPAWGEQGVRQILDRCRDCGIRRVYWRCFDGGRACYPSRLMDPLHGFDEDNYHRGKDSAWVLDALAAYDFGSFDALKAAITYGRRIGVEVHAWLTLNEDDHGWGLTSRFTRENADSRWVRRDGTAFRSQQSFAFEKVRAYKLALLQEVLAYEPDGIFIDWIRTGDVRDNPQTDADGVAIYGYEAPNLEAFEDLYGLDARDGPNSDSRWARVRAKPHTLFMRAASKAIRRANPRLRISVLVQHPWGYRGSPNDTPYKGNLHGLLLDVRAWAQEGLVDEVFAAGYHRGEGTPEKAYRWLRELTGGKCLVGLYGWIASPQEFRGDVALARRLGSSTLLLWESDYLGLAPTNAELVETMVTVGRAAPTTSTAPGG